MSLSSPGTGEAGVRARLTSELSSAATSLEGTSRACTKHQLYSAIDSRGPANYVASPGTDSSLMPSAMVKLRVSTLRYPATNANCKTNIETPAAATAKSPSATLSMTSMFFRHQQIAPPVNAQQTGYLTVC
jgi:hypothetical protein